MKLFSIVVTFFLFVGHALAASAHEMSEKSEEIIEAIFDQLIQIKGAVSFPGNDDKMPLIIWGNEIKFYIDNSMISQIREEVISSLEEITSVARVILTRVGLPSEADLVIVVSRKDSKDLRMDGKWGKVLKSKIEGYKDGPLDTETGKVNFGMRSQGDKGVVRFNLTYFTYSDIETIMTFPWKRIIRMGIHLSIMNTLVIDYKYTILSGSLEKFCLTLADKAFMSLIYGADFKELLDHKISSKEFRTIVRRKYLEVEKVTTENCY